MSSTPHRPSPLHLSPDTPSRSTGPSPPRSPNSPFSSRPPSPAPTPSPIPSSLFTKAKRRFSETIHTPSFTGLKTLGNEVEKKLPKFLQSEELKREGSGEKEVSRAHSVAPTTHRENTALHALLDSLPTLPTLSTSSLPSLPSLSSLHLQHLTTPLSRGISCFTPDISSDEEDVPLSLNPPLSASLPPIEKEKEPKNDPLKKLSGNTIVLGGYRGSILRDAKTNKRLWIPLRVGFGLRRPDLGLGLEDVDEEHSTDTVVPGRMLMAVGGVIDLGKKLKDKLKYLESQPPPPPSATGPTPPPLKFHNWGYDWRRRLELSSSELLKFLENLKAESAERGEGKDGLGEGATVIAHSMGGLVTLHALARAKDPTVFKGILFAGTPFNGCVNVLGPLKKGDGVMFNKEICSPAVVFSMRSSFYFLPSNGACFETPSGASLPVDFFDPQSWSDHNLSPVTGGLFEPAGEKRERLRREGRRDAESARDVGVGMGVLEPGKVGAGEAEGDEMEVEGLGAMEVEIEPEDEELPEESRKDGEVASPIIDTTTLAPPSFIHSHDSPMTTPSSSPPATARENESFPMSREGSGTGTPTLNPHSVSHASDQLIADYLVRTLQRVQQFHREIVDLYSEEKAAKGLYPPMAIITSQKTATVRGIMTPDLESVRDIFYQHLLYGPGDGIVLYESAKSLPGGESKWNRHLKGVVESSHGHVSLLGDLDSVRKALELLST